MPDYTRLIGIDVGTKRVGIAQTDLLKTIATPVGTFSPDEALKELSKIVENSPVEKFIVGWPLTLKGEEGTSTIMVQEFIDKLSHLFPDIEVAKIDERYTSNIARDFMIKAGIPKKKRQEKGRVDRVAAAVILQDYLDSNF